MVGYRSKKMMAMSRMTMVNIQVTDRGAVYIDNTRITGRSTKWGTHNIIFETDAPADQVSQILIDNGFGHIELDPDYAAEAGIQ